MVHTSVSVWSTTFPYFQLFVKICAYDLEIGVFEDVCSMVHIFISVRSSTFTCIHLSPRFGGVGLPLPTVRQNRILESFGLLNLLSFPNSCGILTWCINFLYLKISIIAVALV